MASLADKIKQYQDQRGQGYIPAPPQYGSPNYMQDMKDWIAQLPPDRQREAQNQMARAFKRNAMGGGDDSGSWSPGNDYSGLGRYAMDTWMGGMQDYAGNQQPPPPAGPSPWDDFDPRGDDEGSGPPMPDPEDDLYGRFQAAGGGYNQNMMAQVAPMAGLPGWQQNAAGLRGQAAPGGGYRGMPPRNGIQPLGGGMQNQMAPAGPGSPRPQGNSPFGNQHFQNPYTQAGGSPRPQGNSPFGNQHFQSPLAREGGSPRPQGNSPWGNQHFQSALTRPGSSQPAPGGPQNQMGYAGPNMMNPALQRQGLGGGMGATGMPMRPAGLGGMMRPGVGPRGGMPMGGAGAVSMGGGGNPGYWTPEMMRRATGM